MATVQPNYNVLYHGNCIDGWFSAYIAHSCLSKVANVKMFPISPNQKKTWPKINILRNTHILLLDVSIAEVNRAEWMNDGVLSISCIDHHSSAIEHWPPSNCPINTTACAALQTWQFFYPATSIPGWLYHIDRIDRWDNPTYEDRCIREVLNLIAHKPVQNKINEAFTLTQQFLNLVSTDIGLLSLLAQGKEILDKKDAALLSILNNGIILTITDIHISTWNLPQSWLGISVYIINNTHITLDTTEAAHLIFQHYPAVSVFINYRKKILEVSPTESDSSIREMFIYSARSRDFDLLTGTIFKGHKTSAGCSLLKNTVSVLPFITNPV